MSYDKEARKLQDSRYDDYIRSMEIIKSNKNDSGKRFVYTDDLEQFLFDALVHDDLENAKDILIDKKVDNCSVKEISKASRNLLENYSKLATVKNLRSINLRPLLRLTYNIAFIKSLYSDLIINEKNIEHIKEEGKEIDDLKARVKNEIFLSIGYNFYGGLTCLNIAYERLIEANNEEVASNTKLTAAGMLLCNRWYDTDTFGEPTAYEISFLAGHTRSDAIKTYVLNVYKDVLQTTWCEFGCLGDTYYDYLKKEINIFDYLLVEALSEHVNNPEFVNSLPPANDLTKDPGYMNYYQMEVETITGVLYDIWKTEPWTVSYIANWAIETKHLGLMRFVLAKYSDELKKIVISQNDGIQYSKYDFLSDNIEKLKSESQEYETLREFYDSILRDNNIDLEELTNAYLSNPRKK